MKALSFTRNGERLVIAGALRTPVGQASKSLSSLEANELASLVVEELFRRTGLPKNVIDGVVSGEIAQSSKAPNVARVISVRANLPLEAPAVTVANNCVSGFEAIFEASRRILLGENETMLVTGQESMSNMGIFLDKVKRNPKTATVEKIRKNWAEIPGMPEIDIIDGVEQGLNDPARNAMMFTTAEIVAQKLGLSKEELDSYAHGSYSRTLQAITEGRYDSFIMPVKTDAAELDKDEFIMSKTGFVEKPERFAKAGPIYDAIPGGIKKLYEDFGTFIGKEYKEGETTGKVSLFNSCPQSDGAGALIVTTESRAKELGLPIQAVIRGWGYYGVDPSIMGLGIGYAMKNALEKTGLHWDDISFYEIHEAFAATALGSMVLVRDEFGYDLVKRYAKGDVNRNGGTLAIGHPLGMTGIRVAINQILELQRDSKARYSMGAICAGGGVGGAMILEKI